MSFLATASMAPRILVADDDQDVLSVLTTSLPLDLDLGKQQVVGADTLESAIDRFEQNKGTLWAVLTDMQMPGGGDAGLQLHAHVRRQNPRMPVILMSAGIDQETRQDLNAMQASDPRFKFYQKTVGLEDPLKWLRSVWRMVLLVDDEPALLRAIQRGLTRSLGLVSEDILTAPDLESALQVYADHHQRIAAALTDMEMPRAQGSIFLRDAGLQLYDGIRKKDTTLPVAFMSGGMPAEVRARLDAILGSDARTRFHTKPDTPTEGIADWFRGIWSEPHL